MRAIVFMPVAVLFVALGFWLGVRWAYDDERRWIVRGEDLPY